MWHGPQGCSMSQNYPRTRLPFLRHLVQTLSFLRWPSTTTETRWMLGLNVRATVRWEWLMERPATACLPQISQTFDMTLTSKVRRSRAR